MITITDLLQSFEEAIETELDSQGLAEWSINAAGDNLKDVFSQLPDEDLKDVIGDLTEGMKLKVTIDLGDILLRELEEILRTRKVIRADEDEDEDQVP